MCGGALKQSQPCPCPFARWAGEGQLEGGPTVDREPDVDSVMPMSLRPLAREGQVEVAAHPEVDTGAVEAIEREFADVLVQPELVRRVAE